MRLAANAMVVRAWNELKQIVQPTDDVVIVSLGSKYIK